MLNLPVTDDVENEIDFDSLTAREREILLHVASGMGNQEIADTLIISERTVRTHVSHILGKLYARNRTEAARIVHEQGITVGYPLPVPKRYEHRNGDAEPPAIPGAFWAEWPEPLEHDLVLIARAPWGEWKMRRTVGEWGEYKPHRLRVEGVRFWGPLKSPFDT